MYGTHFLVIEGIEDTISRAHDLAKRSHLLIPVETSFVEVRNCLLVPAFFETLSQDLKLNVTQSDCAGVAEQIESVRELVNANIKEYESRIEGIGTTIYAIQHAIFTRAIGDLIEPFPADIGRAYWHEMRLWIPEYFGKMLMSYINAHYRVG